MHRNHTTRTRKREPDSPVTLPMADVVAKETFKEDSFDDLIRRPDRRLDSGLDLDLGSSSSRLDPDSDAHAHEAFTRKLADRIAREWDVRGALPLINRHGIGLVSQVIEELTELERAGRLPAIRNRAGYFARCVIEAARASAVRGERWVEGAPTRDPLDAYRQSYGRYLKT